MRGYQNVDALAQRLGIALSRDEPMSRHTTFRVGGPVDRMIFPRSREDLRALLRLLAADGIPWRVIGNGSNLLVSDRGLSGVALVLEGEFQEICLLPDGVTVRAGAGLPLRRLCAFARENGLAGLEFAWGIPGTVGGAVFMNAGAYGGETKDALAAATHMTAAGEVATLPAEELGLGYRRSRYGESGDIILRADFRLTKGDPAAIGETMDSLMARRKEKQPIGLPSAGSVFKRPEGGYAAALIERCGLKGERVGGAQVSPKHAGFIVNTGGATCADVLALTRKIQETVLRETGVTLEPEVKILGEF